MPNHTRLFGWNDAKSIALSKFSTLAMGVICLVMLFCGPQLVGWAMRDYAGPDPALPRALLLGIGYLCGALALATLCQLYRLLGRIGRGAVFVRANVTALRRISWCCAGAAVLCLPAGLWLHCLIIRMRTGPSGRAASSVILYRVRRRSSDFLYFSASSSMGFAA